MGASQSTTQSNHPPSRALHVLRVTPSSPASQTDIEPFFDFVVGFEGDSLPSQNSIDAAELERIVEGHEGRTLNLLVWNSKDQGTRVVPVVPSRAWSQPSSTSSNPDEPNYQPSLLGLSMRMCEPEFALDNVWHVLDVLEGSPAESAGLVPYGDYITGWSGGVLSAENDFYDLVEAHIDKPLRVYVYSHDFDALREVVLVPNRHWGGEGLLGCVFGYGLLHRIPAQSEDHVPGMTPPELHDTTDDYEEQELFVPADAQPEVHYTPAQLAEWRQQEHEERNYESPGVHHLHEQHQLHSDHSLAVSTIPEEETSSVEDEDHHEHYEDSPARSTQEETPRRTPVLANSTPSLASLMNGRNPSANLESRSENLPVSSNAGSGPSTIVGARDVFEDSEDDDVRDEETSVADTDYSGSHGSLTSVD